LNPEGTLLALNPILPRVEPFRNPNGKPGKPGFQLNLINETGLDFMKPCGIQNNISQEKRA
jgi:hypothetical protein